MAPRPRPANERFWPHVHHEPNTGCWLWSGATAANRYGVFSLAPDRPLTSAHRASWELHHGAIPDGLCVLHHCDNPPCVNPAHLFLGTHQDNLNDSVAKGRRRYGAPQGEHCNFARLTEADVIAIRSIRKSHPALRAGALTVTQAEIARAFDVSVSTVRAITNHRTWASL